MCMYICINEYTMELKRRVVIYLDSRTPIANIHLNYSYTNKLESLINKTGETRSATAKKLLIQSFGTSDLSELKERIVYAASNCVFGRAKENSKQIGMGSKVGYVCKIALKRAIDALAA